MVWKFQIVTIWTCHHLKKNHSPIKIIDVTVWTCHHLKKIFIFISIWICHHMVCHHMNNIHTCHHFGMKFSDGDRYEFFIPSLHTVTFVTVWRLGMKIFHTCHQKMLSDGDGLIGITIEHSWRSYQTPKAQKDSPERPKSAKEAPNLAKLKTKNMDVLLKTKYDCLQ